MREESQKQSQGHLPEPIPQMLKGFSARDQLDILLQASRSLRSKEKARVFGAVGFHFVVNRGLDVLVRLLIKNLLRGLLWSAIYTIILVFGIFSLALLATNTTAFFTTLATLIAFFAGFFLFTLYDLFHEVIPFLRRTASEEKRKQVVDTLEHLPYQQRAEVLQSMSIRLLGKSAGHSILAYVFTGLALGLIGIVLTSLFLFLSFIAPSFPGFPSSSYMPITAAILAFICGWTVPRLVQHGIDRLVRKWYPRRRRVMEQQEISEK